jgi:hypothetical protein
MERMLRQFPDAMVAHDALSAWESFYVIVGSSAGALTGLQFVVMALVSESDARTGTREIDAFGTPTVVHFCSVLLVAAILSAPWSGLSGAATAVGICGVLGVVYGLIIVRRARRTTVYKPVLEDWIWHTVLPLVAYAVFVVAAANLPRHDMPALFAIAASALLLLFIGIHNAWDTVTYVALGMPATEQSPPSTENAPATSPAKMQAKAGASGATQSSSP